MKTLLKISLYLLLLAGFAACEKETPVVGRLEIEYIKIAANFVSIYTEAENQIYSINYPGSSLSIDLNPGNYAILSGAEGSSSGGRYFFQIQAGKTTRVSYNSSLTPDIEYK